MSEKERVRRQEPRTTSSPHAYRGVDEYDREEAIRGFLITGILPSTANMGTLMTKKTVWRWFYRLAPAVYKKDTAELLAKISELEMEVWKLHHNKGLG